MKRDAQEPGEINEGCIEKQASDDKGIFGTVFLGLMVPVGHKLPLVFIAYDQPGY